MLTNAKKNLYAKGRLKTGEMNKTESAYATHLENLKKNGEIVAFWFEAITLKLASNRCSYTPDFLVLKKNGDLEIHEVKGSLAIFADDAKVKCKTCADKFPFRLLIVYPKPKKYGGGWETLEY